MGEQVAARFLKKFLWLLWEPSRCGDTEVEDVP